MLIKSLALLVMIFILSLPATVLAAESDSGVIEGQLVNGTAGGSSVADQDITLKTSLNDAESGEISTTTDAEGRFVFDGLSTESGYSYEVTLTFQEADYYSDRLGFAEEETGKITEITVYDSTTSDESIRIEAAHTVVYVKQGSLHVEEYFVFANEADRTYIGSGEITATGKRRTLVLPLPDKITNLEYGGELMGCCVISGEEGFFDTMPIYPGAKNIAYYYQVSYSGGEYIYSQRVNYPISGFNLLVQGENTEVTSDWLTVAEPLSIDGIWFNYLAGGELFPGDTQVAQFSNLPQTTNQGAILWWILVVVLLGAGFVFVYMVKKRSLQLVSLKDSPEQISQRLLIQLAKLDDDFESGKIKEGAYRRLRAEVKSQLVELTQS